MGEGDDGSVDGHALQLGGERVAARPRLADALTTGAAVGEQVPVGHLLADLLVRQALVVAVVELRQGVDDLWLDVGHHHGGGVHRPAQRTGEHEGVGAGQPANDRTEGTGLATAELGQRDVGATGVPSDRRPTPWHRGARG